MTRGKFIAFEGCDGSGKTTVSKWLVDQLNREGYPAVYTREPGGSRIAEEIRTIILDPENTEEDVRTEALLYAASRRQHLVEKVLPQLEAGIHVITDRFVFSSLVYQGYARGIGIEKVRAINDFAVEQHYPDQVIYLDIPAQAGIDRIHQYRNGLDRLDQETIDFHQKVHDGYEIVNRMYPDTVYRIDACQPVEQVEAQALAYLHTIL